MLRQRCSFIFLIAVLGCSAPQYPRVVTDPDPSVKIPAIKQSAREHDRAVIGQLVKDLESDDPAVRFYSISALKELTGETFDYLYYGDEYARAGSVEKWQQWLAAQGKPATTQSQ